MLSLTRKEGESIQIGDNVVVHVIQCAHGRLKVAIDAPREIKITRTQQDSVAAFVRSTRSGRHRQPAKAG